MDRLFDMISSMQSSEKLCIMSITPSVSCSEHPAILPWTPFAIRNGTEELLLPFPASSRNISWSHLPWCLLLYGKNVWCPLMFWSLVCSTIRKGASDQEQPLSESPAQEKHQAMQRKVCFVRDTRLPCFLLSGVMWISHTFCSRVGFFPGCWNIPLKQMGS